MMFMIINIINLLNIIGIFKYHLYLFYIIIPNTILAFKDLKEISQSIKSN